MRDSSAASSALGSSSSPPMRRRLHRRRSACVGEPGLDEGRHALDRGQPPQRDREGQRPALRRKPASRVSRSSSAAVVAGLRGASPHTSLATRSRAPTSMPSPTTSTRCGCADRSTPTSREMLPSRSGRGKRTRCSACSASRRTRRSRNQRCSTASAAPKPARVSLPSASRAATSACGSGAMVRTTGMPSSAATSAATIEPTSAIRRCTTSTLPASRSTRRSPRRASTRRDHAVAMPEDGSRSGTCT